MRLSRVFVLLALAIAAFTASPHSARTDDPIQLPEQYAEAVLQVEGMI